MKFSTFFSPASFLCCALATVLGLGAGWFIHCAGYAGKTTRHNGGSAVLASAKAKPPSFPAMPPVTVSAGIPLAAADAKNQVLAQALATAPRVERWLLLVAAAEKATSDEMPGLLRLCQGDNAALRMVAARWADMAPAHMWQTLQQLSVSGQAMPGKADASGLGLSTFDLAQLLLESWTPRDQSAVIAALSAAKDFPDIESLRHKALETFVKTDPESALRAMRDWASRLYVPRMDSVRLWAEKNPQHAAAIAAQAGTTAGGREALATVGKAWAMNDPKSALAYAATLPAAQRHALAAGAMVEWGGRDAQAAAAYLAALPDATLRAGLAPFLVESWAKAAPQQALDWAQENLRGAARATALGSIVGSLAQQDVARAAELVSGLDAGGSKNKAIGSLVEQWFQKDGAAPIADWLLKLPEADAREAGFEKLGFQWLWNSGAEGAAKAAALAIGPQGDLVPMNFLTQIAGDQARRDPVAAMKWADQLPPGRITQTRQGVLSEWMQARPEAATEWVLDQPAGDARHGLITAASHQLLWNATPETAQIFFARLPAAERVQVRESLRTLPVPEEKRRLLEAAFQTP